MIYVSKKALERSVRISSGDRPSPTHRCITMHLSEDCPWREKAELVAVEIGDIPKRKKCGYCFG
jgi:hypothetical protein